MRTWREWEEGWKKERGMWGARVEKEGGRGCTEGGSPCVCAL